MRNKSKTTVNYKNIENLKEEVSNLKNKMLKKKQRLALSNEPPLKKYPNNNFFQTDRGIFGEKDKFRNNLLKNSKKFNKKYDKNNFLEKPKPLSFHLK